ncbi:MAG TPA: hypothetical protein VGN09_29120 [Vicinamibacteria bacterium]
MSLVLMFMVGFPVSLPLCGFDGYFIALAAPLLWGGFGAVVSHMSASGRAARVGTRLLLIHYIGILIGLLAVPWAVESSAHVPAKSVAAVVLVLFVYAAGQIAWWRVLRLLDRLVEGAFLPRPALGSLRLARLVAGVLALTFAFVALAEHETLVLNCRRATGECEIVRRGWRTSTRHIPLEEIAVSFGVPRSRLEIASPTRRETLLGVACTERKTGTGRGLFSRCESRGGGILAATSEFLVRNGGGDLHVVDEDPWPSRAAAAILGALGLWLVVSAFVTLRARTFLPRYRSSAPRPPAYRPPASRPRVYPRRSG